MPLLAPGSASSPLRSPPPARPPHRTNPDQMTTGENQAQSCVITKAFGTM